MTTKQANMRARVLAAIEANPGQDAQAYGFTAQQLGIYGFAQLEQETPAAIVYKTRRLADGSFDNGWHVATSDDSGHPTAAQQVMTPFDAEAFRARMKAEDAQWDEVRRELNKRPTR
jgi:hypothetical protein